LQFKGIGPVEALAASASRQIAGRAYRISHRFYLQQSIETMTSVQIFGLKSSQATRAAERFFKERRIAIHYVDLSKKPMAPAEIKRFADRFGLTTLLDTEGKSYVDAGLKYLKVSESELLARIERDPKLLRLPLIRGGKHVSVGHDEASWKLMLT
jgi:arsenate reductase-like glutaredoxin family protein